MNNDKIVGLKKPEEFEDELTALLPGGARQLLAEAIEAEVEDFLEAFQDYKDSRGHRHVVRNGYLPEREVQTGIGSISVKVPKTRDRSGSGLKFQSQLLPPYLRRSKSMEDVIPWLYLKGISTGDFQEALAALVGPDAKGLSAGAVSRLKSKWQQEHKQWAGRSLESKRYVYFWADGIYFNIRADEARQCILVIIGVTEQGRKEFVAIEDGYRESEQSWRELLLSLKNRGLSVAPKLAVGDGALGFWKALSKVYGQTRHQRCWVHKTANILNNLPKTQQLKAKSNLHEIWMAATREDAHKAFDHFISTYQSKYPKASECLEKDRDALLAFYDFPAEHWQHIRRITSYNVCYTKLLRLKNRGLSVAPKLAVGDGALGFWKSVEQSLWSNKASALLGA
uniref:Mutator family transposase n=1 Tax=Magnetococcus massalia (strain MO-1) TaxID=451514 RepID=A0A1S7LK96_MAGMO